MEIETVKELAEKLADWIGIYGGCKSDGDVGCTYDKNEPFCCRQGFLGSMEERIRESVENDKKLESVGFLFTKKEKERINRTKSLFKSYFDSSYGVDSISSTPSIKLGITDIQFKFDKEILIMEVTLTRPGLLIGRCGKTLKDITKYLSTEDEPVDIRIFESKI